MLLLYSPGADGHCSSACALCSQAPVSPSSPATPHSVARRDIWTPFLHTCKCRGWTGLDFQSLLVDPAPASTLRRRKTDFGGSLLSKTFSDRSGKSNMRERHYALFFGGPRWRVDRGSGFRGAGEHDIDGNREINAPRWCRVSNIRGGVFVRWLDGEELQLLATLLSVGARFRLHRRRAVRHVVNVERTLLGGRRMHALRVDADVRWQWQPFSKKTRDLLDSGTKQDFRCIFHLCSFCSI